MALQQPCSRKMLTELIIAKKGTLLGVLQNAQEIGGLGSITETHKSFFQRKFCTTEA
jgi:hypothetical protein